MQTRSFARDVVAAAGVATSVVVVAVLGGLVSVASGQSRGGVEELASGLLERDGVRTVLVMHRGKVAAERYRRGFDRNRPHNLKSASKSLLSAGVGIALERGVLEDVDRPVVELLPSEVVEGVGPAARRVTLRHLLTMTAGLESTSGRDYGAWVSSASWLRAAFSRPVVAAPGERFIYSTGNTHLLSAALATASGRPTRELLQEELLDPLGATITAWDRGPEGYHFGGNNLAMSALDLARFGQLYLQRGRWEGRAVVPRAWVEESTRVHSEGWPERYGAYGYLWWIPWPEASDAFMAVGYGGQFLVVVPEHEAVVVVLSTHDGKGAAWDRTVVRDIRTLVTAL